MKICLNPIPYEPIYFRIFTKNSYTWDEIDSVIYVKILRDEGYSDKEIQKELSDFEMRRNR